MSIVVHTVNIIKQTQIKIHCTAGLVCVSSVAAERLKDGTDLVWHQDITATPIVC